MKREFLVGAAAFGFLTFGSIARSPLDYQINDRSSQPVTTGDVGGDPTF